MRMDLSEKEYCHCCEAMQEKRWEEFEESKVDWSKAGKTNCYIPKGFTPPYLIDIDEDDVPF